MPDAGGNVAGAMLCTFVNPSRITIVFKPIEMRARPAHLGQGPEAVCPQKRLDKISSCASVADPYAALSRDLRLKLVLRLLLRLRGLLGFGRALDSIRKHLREDKTEQQ
jgi:hypothetical protein